jgi:hypothetical protein
MAPLQETSPIPANFDKLQDVPQGFALDRRLPARDAKLLRSTVVAMIALPCAMKRGSGERE